MTGYEIYCEIRGKMGRTIPGIDAYLKSENFNYYESLAKYLVRSRKLSSKAIKDFILSNYNNDPSTFNPFTLMEDQPYKIYIDWKMTNSSKALYFQSVIKSFKFIENFCISKKLLFENYKEQYAAKHIYHKKIEYVVAAYLKLVNIRKLKKRTDNLLLTSYKNQYNTIIQRISNLELNALLSKQTLEMNGILNEMSKDFLKGSEKVTSTKSAK